MNVTATKRQESVQFRWNYNNTDVTYNLTFSINMGTGVLIPVYPIEVNIDYDRLADNMIAAYGDRVKERDRTELINQLRKSGPYSLTIE